MISHLKTKIRFYCIEFEITWAAIFHCLDFYMYLGGNMERGVAHVVLCVDSFSQILLEGLVFIVEKQFQTFSVVSLFPV